MEQECRPGERLGQAIFDDPLYRPDDVLLNFELHPRGDEVAAMNTEERLEVNESNAAYFPLEDGADVLRTIVMRKSL
jgi:hypothetical protein